MIDLSLALSALTLGTLTVVHPCPIATQLAALSSVSAWHVDRFGRLKVTLSLLFGLQCSYISLAIILSSSFLSIPRLVHILNHSVGYFIGPILILLGVHFAGWLSLPLSKNNLPWLKIRQKKWNVLGSFLFGFVLALVFCPFSAGVFFAALLPMAIEHESNIALPFMYGLGSGIPMLVWIILLHQGEGLFERRMANHKLLFEKLQKVTGVLLALVGLYYTLNRLYFPSFNL